MEEHELLKEGSNREVDETNPPIENIRASIRIKVMNALMENASNTGMRINLAEALAESIMKELFEAKVNSIFHIKRYIKRLEEK
jgi:hypothetical protein